MKYIAPAVFETVNATDLIQGNAKDGVHSDSNDITKPSLTPGYGSDE